MTASDATPSRSPTTDDRPAAPPAAGAARSAATASAGRSPHHRLVLRGILNRLEDEFGDRLTRPTLERCLTDSYEELAGRSRVWTHVPAFVERCTRQRLRAMVRNQGLSDDRRPVVLFICRRNDGLSQVAAALFARSVGSRAIVVSAGPDPAEDLLADAVHALAEVGIELLDEFPKLLTPEVEESANVIVTLDGHDDIAVVGERHYEAWPIGDPDGGSLESYRRIRDDLAVRVDELVGRVAPPAPAWSWAGFDDDLERLATRFDRMGRDVLGAVGLVAGALGAGVRSGLAEVIDGDDRIDAAHHALAARVLELIALHQPVAGDLRMLLAVDAASLQLARIGDRMVDVAVTAARGGLASEVDLSAELVTMATLVETMTGDAVSAIVDQSLGRVDAIVGLAGELDDAHGRVFGLLTGGGSARDLKAAIEIDRVSRALARAGEHAVDVVEQAVFAITGELRELGR